VFILLSRGHLLTCGAACAVAGSRLSHANRRPCRAGRRTTRTIMIRLTRLNGQQFVMNAEKIRYVEATPDTVVCSDTGEKLMVKENIDEVIRRAIDYARLIRRPVMVD
jgi:flagellar protein FlbD